MRKTKKPNFSKINNKIYMVWKVTVSAVEASKLFYKTMFSDNNFNRFYKTFTTPEKPNTDQTKLPHFLKLQIENES